MTQFFDSSEEEQLRSEYEYKMQELTKAMRGISDYCRKLDGTKSELHLELIRLIQKDLAESSMSSKNVHEAMQSLTERVDSIKKYNAGFSYNAYKNEDILINEVTTWLVNQDFSFTLEYEQPLFEIIIPLDKCQLLIRNTHDITLELFYNDTKLLETRDTKLIKNQITFIIEMTK